jgi:ATP-binding cassette subfamily F protein uup
LERVAKARIEERQMHLKASNVYIGSKIFECQYISKAFRSNNESDDQASQNEVVIMKDFYYNFSRF